MVFLGPTKASIAQYRRPVDDGTVVLNKGQQQVFDAITTNPDSHFRVSGAAGTGKTSLMRRVSEGMAVKAYTLHGFMGLRPGQDVQECREVARIVEPNLLHGLRRVCLEEIGMVTASMLTLLDALLREGLKKPRVPFGGVQVVAVGDFLQMPSVGNDGVETLPLWASLKMTSFELTEQMRLDNKDDEMAFAVGRLRTLFLEDRPPPPMLSHVIDTLSVDTGQRRRPTRQRDRLLVCMTRKLVSATNLREMAVFGDADPGERIPEGDDDGDDVGRVLVVSGGGSGGQLLRTPENKPVVIHTRDVLTERWVGPGEARPAEHLDFIEGLTPLVFGCPICVTVNTEEDGEDEEVGDGDGDGGGTHNGQTGRFLGFTSELPVKDVGIRGSFGAGRPPVVVDGVEFRQVTAQELMAKRIGFRVRLDDGGGVRVLYARKKTDGGGDKGGVFVPVRCGRCVTASSLQGLTVTRRMHINFKGVSSFDPQILYMLMTRPVNRALLSLENMNSHGLCSWWKRVRENAAEGQRAGEDRDMSDESL